MKTLIIGLGNPILGDDAVGCRIAEELEKQLTAQAVKNVEVEQFYRGGIALMEHLIGYDQVLIIDSIQGWKGTPGDIYHMSVDDLPTLTADSPHDTSLKAALELGRNLGVQLPDKIDILAMEIKASLDFTEQLSPAIQANLPEMLKMALQWVQQNTPP